MRSNGVKNRISNYMIKHLTGLNINELGFKKLLTIMFSTNVFKVGSKFFKWASDGLHLWSYGS
jgi:hypothetical protein